MQELESSSLTDPGRKRSNNEDCYLSLPEHNLWMVADGMGGHEAGEVASAIVYDTFKTQPQEPLEQLIQRAHQAVLSAAQEGIGAEGMGSTVVALRWQQNSYEIAWVGDSRAYLFSPSAGLERLTTDHSYVQMLIQSGAIDAHEAEHHPDKNIITQCVGSQQSEALKVDSIQRHGHRGQWILLCSDGLSDELEDSEIAQILHHSDSPATASSALLKAALAAGGGDNITLQVIAAPKAKHRLMSMLGHGIPAFTHSRRIDVSFYISALVILLLLLYWIVN